MRRGRRIGVLLGTALLLASCATGSPYAYAPAYACEGCYGYPGYFANDFDGGYYRYYRPPLLSWQSRSRVRPWRRAWRRPPLRWRKSAGGAAGRPR